MPTSVARLACNEHTARHIAAMVSEALPEDTACSAFENSDGQWSVEIYFETEPEQAAIRHFATLAGADPNAMVFETVAERDWIRNSLSGLTPVRAGHFVVHGSHDRANIAPNAVAIEIEAALAFGTGHHGTTRGCLIALDIIAKRRRIGSVLDIGTGSGVLAIAAAKAFRTAVLASDIDPVAVTAARGNARLNRTAAYITAIRADGVRVHAIRARAPFALIFANILLEPLRRMANSVAALAAPGGFVVLSGLLPVHAHAALVSYRAQGLVLERRMIVDGWATLILRRPVRSQQKLRLTK